MNEKQIYARAYNSGVIAARALDIVNEEEKAELLLNPTEVWKLYKIIFQKLGEDKEKFKDYIYAHVAIYIGAHNKEFIPSSKSEAIKWYHELLEGYFGNSIKVIGKETVNVVIKNCPYKRICEKTGCIRKYSIESVIEVLAHDKVSIFNEKEKDMCVLSYSPGYDSEVIKKFEEIEKEIEPRSIDEILKERLEELIE